MKKQDEEQNDFSHRQNENHWSKKNESHHQEEELDQAEKKAVNETNQQDRTEPKEKEFPDHSSAVLPKYSSHESNTINENKDGNLQLPKHGGEDPNFNAEVENKSKDMDEKRDVSSP